MPSSESKAEKEAKLAEKAVATLNRRVNDLERSPSYQTWLESFSQPFTYHTSLFKALDDECDFTLYFGNSSVSSLKVPIILLCTVSKPLRDFFINQLRQRQPFRFEQSASFFYWWLVNFISKPCPMPNAEGLAAVLLEAKRLDLAPIVHICRMYLSTLLNLSSFPHVLNIAVETNDEEYLTQCSGMVAAWSDELLASPHVSALNYSAMLHLLEDPNLSPSSELVVFNAVVRWARNRKGKFVGVDVNNCLKKVRFLLIREDLFQQEVLPSGLFPVQEVEAMRRVRHGLPLRKRDVLSLVHDPILQQTSRPEVLKTLFVGKPLHELEFKYVPYEVTESREDRPICFFKVDKPVLLRRISSKCFLDEKICTLKVEGGSGFRVTGPWEDCSCSFEKPLPLRPKISYRFEYVANAGRAAQEVCNSFEQTVENVTFEGMQFCSNFSLEFVTFQTDDLETIDKMMGAMRPTDNEEVMRHQLETLDRLIALREVEQTERLLLGAQLENPGNSDGVESQEFVRLNGDSDSEEFETLAVLVMGGSNADDNTGASGTEANNAAVRDGAGRASLHGASADSGSESLQVNNTRKPLVEQLEEAMEDAFP